MERALAGDMRRIFRKIAAAAARHVLDGHAHSAPNVAQRFDGEIRTAMERRMIAAATASARLTYGHLVGGGKAWAPFDETKLISLLDVVQRTIRNWLTSYGAAKVRNIVETTRKAIRKALVKGAEESEPPRIIARRIRDEVGGEIAKARSLTIARTEIGTASSVGQDEAARVTNLTLDKVWNATEDHRTRPDHAAANGQRVAMDATFTVGGVALRYPRDPDGPAAQVINCRCQCTYEPRLPR